MTVTEYWNAVNKRLPGKQTKLQGAMIYEFLSLDKMV